MSWQATAWADSLEYGVVGPLAFRVLVKLANVANETGTIAFRNKSEVATELGVTQRSIQRAFRELEAAVLIKPGDQSFVRHIRADKRPTVYELNFRWKTQYSAPELPWPVDESGETELSTGASGETTVVAAGRQLLSHIERSVNTPRDSSRGNHRSDGLDQLRARCAPPFKVHAFDEHGRCSHSCGVHANGLVIDPKTGEQVAPPIAGAA